MDLDIGGIGAVADFAGKLIDKFIPDANAAAAAKADLLKMQVSGDLANMAGQLAVDEEEAKSTNWFVAGWRPAVGWVCVLAFAYSFVVLPFLEFGVYTWGSPDLVKQIAQLPKLDLSTMMPVLLGMLGLGAMRSYEKVNNSEGNR